MSKEEVLKLKTRRQIYSYILKHPGLHEREISRQINIPLGTVDYHLFFLKKRGLVIDRSDGRYTRYYITGKIGTRDKKIIAVLRQSVLRKVIMFLLLNPDSFHREICDHLGLAPSTISFHLSRLADLYIINRVQIGRETKYQVEEPEYISDLLITYQKSFFDDAVDRFVEAWLELHPRYLRKKKKEKSEINLLSLFGTLQLRR